MADLSKIRKYTNDRLKSWYKEVEISYGIKGSGKIKFDTDSKNGVVQATINYIESGKKMEWSNKFHIKDIDDNNIDWIFNIWAEEG